MKNDSTVQGMPTRWVVVALGAVVVVLLAGLIMLLMRPVTVVSSFEQCKEAGGSLLETYPEQCLINGTTFTNTEQSTKDDDAHYVGLTEEAALAKAKQSKTPARVVERDGEALPVTMDLVMGRHNFYIKDGKVYKVEIEGQGSDTDAK